MPDHRPLPQDPAAPPAVPGYHLEELLGRGGSGEVWRAVPRRGGPPVAVKVLVAGDPERQAREAALLGELDHPHLVRLHEVVHQPRRGEVPRVALVLDLLAGGSLAALLARRGRLRPGEVVTALAPVASALAHAHEHGVVHGDLSPGNIVFTAEGRPVLTDLGVARVLGEAGTGEVTPPYVDPTVARGGAPGPASDVFGVAAAAYHALTGIPPWNAATPADTVEVAAVGCLPDLAELAHGAPAELIAVIVRGLAADPADRGTAAAFALDLRHACRPEPVRLPVAGMPAVELGRTGAAPRTELTHQVPARRRPSPGPGGGPGGRAARRQTGARRRPGAGWRPGSGRRSAHGTRVRRVARRWTSGLLARVLLPVALLGAVAGLLAAVWTAGHEPGDENASGPRASVAAATSPATAGSSGAATGSPAGEDDPGPAGQQAMDQPDEPATPAEWAALVGELYHRRARALTEADSAVLGTVYTSGSPQGRGDEAYVTRLRAAGERLQGFAPAVVGVSTVTATERGARLSLADVVPDYRIVLADGTPSTVAGRGEAHVTLVLDRTPEGWRISSAQRDPAP